MQKIEKQKDDLCLSDIWRVIKEYHKFLLISLSLFALLCLYCAYSRLLIWQGAMVIQLGQNTSENPKKSLNDAIAKLSNSHFTSKISRETSLLSKEKSPFNELYLSSYRVFALNNLNLIEIHLLSYSKEYVQLLLLTTFNQIKNEYLIDFKETKILQTKIIGNPYISEKTISVSFLRFVLLYVILGLAFTVSILLLYDTYKAEKLFE